MATGGNGVTYGVGPAAKKLNTGPAVDTVSVLQPDGSVKVDGKVVFDPSKDAVEVNLPDPDIDYVAGVGADTREDSQPVAGRQSKKTDE